MINDEQRLREIVEELSGSRKHGQKNKAAVRIEDLSDLLKTPPKLQAEKTTSDTVSPEQFNKLVEDNIALHKVMFAIAQRLQGRILP